MKGIFSILAVLYVFIGAAHSIGYSIFISRSDCINPEQRVSD